MFHTEKQQIQMTTDISSEIMEARTMRDTLKG